MWHACLGWGWLGQVWPVFKHVWILLSVCTWRCRSDLHVWRISQGMKHFVGGHGFGLLALRITVIRLLEGVSLWHVCLGWGWWGRVWLVKYGRVLLDVCTWWCQSDLHVQLISQGVKDSIGGHGFKFLPLRNTGYGATKKCYEVAKRCQCERQMMKACRMESSLVPHATQVDAFNSKAFQQLSIRRYI